MCVCVCVCACVCARACGCAHARITPPHLPVRRESIATGDQATLRRVRSEFRERSEEAQRKLAAALAGEEPDVKAATVAATQLRYYTRVVESAEEGVVEE